MRMVSIIMPTYMGRKTISESIQSALAQTYPDVELIIVDDASPDESYRQWLQKQQSDRVRVILAERGGPAAARNIGIAAAKGEYILPLDDDDLIDPTYVEKAVRMLENDSKIGVVYCKARRFGAVDCAWELPPFSIPQMLVDNVVFVSAVFRKTLWEQAGGFCTTMEHGLEDYDFWLSLLDIGTQFYQIPEELFYCRVKKRSRNTGFSDDETQINAVYQQLYERHRLLYQTYQSEYLRLLRKAWVHSHFLASHGYGFGKAARAVQKIINWIKKCKEYSK